MERGIDSWRDACDKASKVKRMAETRRERTGVHCTSLSNFLYI